jgi:hypothetical protein
MMNEIISTSMETSSSNHKNPPWRTANNCLMQLFTYFPLPKWGISNNLRILVFTKLSTHYFGCNIGSHNDLVPKLSIYTFCTNYGNFLVSDTSWSVYHNPLMQPIRLGVSCTPYGMRYKMIEASGCLHGDHTMGCFPFLCVGALDVPASGSPSQPNSGFPVIYFELHFLLLHGPHHRLCPWPIRLFPFTFIIIHYVGCFGPGRLLWVSCG